MRTARRRSASLLRRRRVARQVARARSAPLGASALLAASAVLALSVLLAPGCLLGPRAALAQTAGGVRRVGVVYQGGADDAMLDGLHKWPTMFYAQSLVVRGGLAGYGQNYHEIGRLSAKHVQRILAGTPPRDIPVENYDRIELTLNLRTAREIGLAIPSELRARADQLIE